MNKNKNSPIVVYILISFFVTIFLSNVVKYSYFELQNQIGIKNQKISELYEQINNLNNDISKLSRDERIIDFARNKLSMKFPDSQDIICVQRRKVSHNDFKYTFQNFISPEVLASDK